MAKKFIPTIAIDFDGVIHSYASGWKGEKIILDDPVPGAIDFLYFLTSTGTPINAVIFSSRAKTWGGRRAIRKWLYQNSGDRWNECSFNLGIESIKITAKKPAASVYLDDRAVRFQGTFPELTTRAMNDFVEQKPWNK